MPSSHELRTNFSAAASHPPVCFACISEAGKKTGLIMLGPGWVSKFLDEYGVGRRLLPAWGGFWMFAMALTFAPQRGGCAEFTAFKLVDFEGALRLGYSFAETNIDKSDGTGTYEQRPANDQELTLNTRSYIFHPNLLEMELGAGMRFEQEDLENDKGTNHAEGTYYDFNGRWNFLKNKPYPFSLYYTQRNPTKAVGIADVLTVETKNYGLSLFLRQPLVSTPISVRVDHIQNRSDGSTTIVDDTTDTIALDVSGNISDYGYGGLGITRVSQESASGSRSLPLQKSISDTDSVDWSGKFSFGEKRNVYLTNYLLLTQHEQSNSPDRDQATFYNHLGWDISDTLQLFNTYNFSNTSYEADESTNQSMVLGVTKRMAEWWTVNSTIEATSEINVGFERSASGATAGIVYRGPLSKRWTSSMGYSVLYRFNSQVTDVFTISVLDETHVLTGLTAVPLDHEFVVSGTVVVSNQARTQVYVENVDYRLTEVGTETRIERLPTGNIADGETVVVDYDYESGGSLDYEELNQSVSLQYTLDKRYTFFAAYATNEQTLKDGIPLRALESTERYRVGMDAQVPLAKTMEYGWKLEMERHVADLHPFTRKSMDLNFSARLPFAAAMIGLSGGYENVDNELSDIDIDETYYTVAISARPTWTSAASLEWSQRKDIGGESIKRTHYAALRYSWTRGKLGFSLVGKQSMEERGDTSRDHTMIEANLTRQFR